MAVLGTLTVSTIASSGTPNICPPASTVMTWVIITLNGRENLTVVPWPARLSIETRPPTRSDRRADRVHADASTRKFGHLRWQSKNPLRTPGR